MNKEKTALQLAIEELDKVSIDKSPDYIFGVMKAIKVLERYLPTEKEIIIEAFKQGESEAMHPNWTNAENYYQQTFETLEK